MDQNLILPEEVLFEEIVDDCLEIIDYVTPDPPYYYDCACHSFYLYLTGNKTKAYNILKQASYDDFKNLFYNLSVQNNVPYLKITLQFLHDSLNIEDIFDPNSYHPLTETIDEDNKLLHSDAHLFSQNLYNAKRFDDSKKLFLLLNEQASLYITAKFLGKNNDYDMLAQLYEETQSQYFLVFMYQILFLKKEEKKALDILNKITTENALISVRKFLIANKQNTKEINQMISKYKDNQQLNENENEKIHTFAICQSITHALSLYEKNKINEAADIFRLHIDQKSCLIIGHALLEHNDEETIDLMPNTDIFNAFRYCIAYKNGDEFEAFEDMLSFQFNLGGLVCADFLLDQNQLKQSLSIGKQLDPFGKQFIEGDEYTSHYARHLYVKGHCDEAMNVWRNGKYPSRGLSFLIAVKDETRIRRIIEWSSHSEKPVCAMKLYRNDRNYLEYILDFCQFVTGEKNIEAIAEFLLSFNEVEGIQFLYNKTGNEFYLQKLAQFTFDKGEIDKALSMFDSLYYENAIFQGSRFLLLKDKLEESILLIKKTTSQEKIEEFIELLYKKNHHRKAFELFSSLDDDKSICSAAIFLLNENNFEQSRILYQQIHDPAQMFKYGRFLLKNYDELAYQIFIHLQSDKMLNKAAKVMYEKDVDKSYNIFKLIKSDLAKRRYAKFLYLKGKASEAMNILTSLNDVDQLDKALWFLLSMKNYEGSKKLFEKFKTFETPAVAWFLTWQYDNDDTQKAKEKFAQIQKHEYKYWHEVKPIQFLIQKGEFDIAKFLFSRLKNGTDMGVYVNELYKAGKKDEALNTFNNNYTKSLSIVLQFANFLSTLTGEDDKANYNKVKQLLKTDEFYSAHGMFLLGKKKNNEAVEMFRKIKGQKYGSNAAFVLYNCSMNDVAKEFHLKFPSSEIYRINGIKLFNERKIDESWEQFNSIQDQKQIVKAAEFLLYKNEFDKAVILFRRYHEDMDPKLAFMLAIEFHKREMFEDANFYYHLSNTYQAKTILSKCFRENTVGAFKKPKTFQKVFFSLKHKKVNKEDDDISVSTSSDDDLSHLEEIEDIDQNSNKKTKEITKKIKKAESYYSKASETYNALSVIYSFIPLILSLVRLIQSCSITVSESSIHFVDNFIKFFEWSTKLFNIVAFDWFKFSPINTEQSLLILTFLCTYLLSLLSISLNNGYRSLLACFVNSIIFIPIGIGLDFLPSTLGICLFCILTVLYVIVSFFVMKYVKNPIPRYILCNFLGEKIIESKLQLNEENKHFGWFSNKKHVSDHVYINMNLSLLIPIVIFILLSFGILRSNNLIYLIIAICAVIYIVCIILQAKLKKRIFTFMQIVGNFVAYFAMIVGQLMLIPFIEMLTEKKNGEKLNKTVIVFAVAFSILFPYISIIVSCIHIYKMKKTQKPFFIRIWLLNSYSSAASLCSELKLNSIFWPIFDFGYHIVYAIVNTFGKSIVNIVLSSFVIVLTLVVRPYFLISQNILYISEPIVILFLNILIYVNDIKKPIEISIGYVLIAVALVPMIFSILFYWIYEKRRDHEFYLMMKEINDPKSCCCTYNRNAIAHPFSTDDLNKKIFYEPKTHLYHELFRNEQNYAESVKTDTSNPDCIPNVHFIKKKVDPISLNYGDILNKIIIGPGMIFTASAVCYMIRKLH